MFRTFFFLFAVFVVGFLHTESRLPLNIFVRFGWKKEHFSYLFLFIFRFLKKEKCKMDGYFYNTRSYVDIILHTYPKQTCFYCSPFDFTCSLLLRYVFVVFYLFCCCVVRVWCVGAIRPFIKCERDMNANVCQATYAHIHFTNEYHRRHIVNRTGHKYKFVIFTEALFHFELIQFLLFLFVPMFVCFWLVFFCYLYASSFLYKFAKAHPAQIPIKRYKLTCSLTICSHVKCFHFDCFLRSIRCVPLFFLASAFSHCVFRMNVISPLFDCVGYILLS